MKITVTKKHIKIGEPGDPCNCPVALAIKESFGTDNVSVRLSVVSVNRRLLLLPWKATRFIKTFDISNNPHKFRPFSFELVKA